MPYMLIVGDKEEEQATISLRARTKGNLGTMKIEEFIEKIEGELNPA
ncbi:MAG: His/Gly/Thr/Pro-type tRNA ligase C-terminal domain-containing protein [Candidatus Omnitrophota bacterium]|nr:His/Gly/Thr/Pro-type tRNA ligase C-terminal domain-containing protein [Candidatus Omnitrophota bacterium]